MEKYQPEKIVFAENGPSRWLLTAKKRILIKEIKKKKRYYFFPTRRAFPFCAFVADVNEKIDEKSDVAGGYGRGGKSRGENKK